MPAAAWAGEVPDLVAELTALLAQVPRGRVTTYGDLAKALGDVRAARWIGEYLLHHPHGSRCACHRVVRANGAVGLFIAGNAADKVQRLRHEGVTVDHGIADLDVCVRADDFDTSAPLRSLQVTQSAVARRVCERPLSESPTTLCGLDVAYRANGDAVGAAALLDADSQETIAEVTHCAPAAFPYIPGYLTFRELPVLLALWEQLRARAGRRTVCLVDGNGRMHPRRAGVASVFGVTTGVPTIGVTKSRLCGRVLPSRDTPGKRPVVDGEELLGIELQDNDQHRPIYVSIGHRITLTEAVEIVRHSRSGGRLPEPTRRADRLSRIAKR